MLYRFKSQATGDVTMLEPVGRRVLEIIGKTPGAQGIVQVGQIPAAIEALEAAIARENTQRQQAVAEQADDEKANVGDTHADEFIALHQRAQPFIDMLQRSHAEGKDVVWGV